MYKDLLSNKSSQEKFQLLFGLSCMLLLIIAYLSHLGFLPMNYENDEARRALVANEMMLSGDYITPTLNGEIYLNKPPLYNWIIILSFKLFGQPSMFALRFPVIVATIGMGLTIYYFTKKTLHTTIAFFTAFAFMTNGRTLIYDSFVGLIDTSFAWTVYLSFMLIYFYGEKKKYYHLFLLTYLLTAAGFMMKGLPALVFEAFSLLTYFIWKKRFKALFHPAHFAGIGLFLLLCGSYYLAYFSKNHIAPAEVFGRLLSESSKRTVTQYGISRTIIHLFTFPFEFLYHFSPWTLFVIVFFQKGVWKKIRQHDFVFYSLLLFFVNIIVYWTSPEVYARYLFMFLPLIFSTWFYLFFDRLKAGSWQHKLINFIAIGMSILLMLTFLILPFLKVEVITGRPVFKSFLLVILFAFVVWQMYRFKAYRLYFLIPAVIFFRFGFNWFIMEPRAGNFARSEAIAEKIVQAAGTAPLYILKNAEIGNFDAKSFQVEIRRKEILRFTDSLRPGAFYIADSSQVVHQRTDTVFNFDNYGSTPLRLIQILHGSK